MKKLKLVGLFLTGFVIGGLAVNYCWGRLFSQTVTSREVEFAVQSAFEAEWLAELRLGQTTNVIESLETSMDANLSAIAS